LQECPVEERDDPPLVLVRLRLDSGDVTAVGDFPDRLGFARGGVVRRVEIPFAVLTVPP